ncbi:MAG: DEAD/DEAH box helicase family protein [Candidatus Moranbacteria bacterium]|jgi:type I restriction enzyme R subunit|nr:DEAD/DEAH box helicase family protein [Candidatus Moranbacteria bacterium]
MAKINEATDTDLKIIEDLKKLGWKVGDTLLYQQEYALTPEQQKQFEGKKSVKPDITLLDLNHNIVAIFENKFENEKKALTKLRTLYAAVLKPRFLYACSPERVLFYDTEWKGLEAGEFRQVNSLMTLEEMQLKIEQARKINLDREITIDKGIAGGINPSCGKETYYQAECIQALIQRYKEGKQKMLVHMATGLGKTRTMVAFTKALLEYNMAKRVLFVVDRVMLAEQAINDGFSLISKEYSAVRITSGNYKQYKNAQIHVVVIDTLENIYQNIPSTFYDLIIVDECHRSININRKLIFDHFLCPRVGLTATPRTAVAKKGVTIPDEDLAILDTYRLFGCETGEPDYQFDLTRGIDEGFLAPYQVLSIETELIKTAKEIGVEFDHYIDPETEEVVNLESSKKIKLEQLNRKFIAWDNCLRIAEELKANTEYGEKIILFGVSQSHAVQLVKAINQVFKTSEDELSPRYAEAIISENDELNATFKKWFKDQNHKPFVAVSVDIMSTGVDIPCVRYIAFANLTKSVGKYIQMLGRGTRLDPKTGKFSFKVLDFVGLCQKMEDNGKGTAKENKKIISMAGGTTSQGTGSGTHGTGHAGIIDNPDPAHLIQRVYLHGDSIKVIDNIPTEKAKEIFEEEINKNATPEIVEIKKKVKADENYEPSEQEIDEIKVWSKNPNVYLDEGQLQKAYDFEQGSIWDFFLHALKIKKIPTPKERVERGFDSYVQTYNFNDKQIQILRDMKDIVSANIAEKKRISPQEVFNNPVFVRIIGADYQEVNQTFDNRFPQVFEELQSTFKV